MAKSHLWTKKPLLSLFSVLLILICLVSLALTKPLSKSEDTKDSQKADDLQTSASNAR